MEQATIDAIDAGGMGDAEVKNVASALGTTDFAMNHYRLAPGENFTGGQHAHLDQEEVFYVLSGTATFETPEATHEIEAGEAIRFAPGEYQQGKNEGDEEVIALALGAPKESTDVRLAMVCPECGDSDSMALSFGEDGPVLDCPACGTQVEADL